MYLQGKERTTKGASNMRTFKMKDVERIEKLLKDGRCVMVTWHTPYGKGEKQEIVTNVRWDGLVFTNGDCIYTGIDKVISIETVEEIV